MANKINNKSHSLAVKPYDDSQWNDINLYNKLPYKWDEELIMTRSNYIVVISLNLIHTR